MPESPIYVLTTAQAGPMLTPYRDSGQITELLAGPYDAGLNKGVKNDHGLVLKIREAHQTGLLLLAVMLVLGALLAGRPFKKSENGRHYEFE
jgi:hypothetical protein